MFCNTPGNASEDGRIQNINLLDDEISDRESEVSTEHNSKTAAGEHKCSSGFCQSDWKPNKEKSA